MYVYGYYEYKNDNKNKNKIDNKNKNKNGVRGTLRSNFFEDSDKIIFMTENSLGMGHFRLPS